MSYQPPSQSLPPGQEPEWGQQPSKPLPPNQPDTQWGQQPQRQGSQQYPQQPQYPQPGAFQQSSQKTRKPMSRGTKIGCGVVAAVIVLVIVIVAAASGGSKGSPTTSNESQATQQANQSNPTQAPQATHAPQPTPKPTVSYAHFDDGTYQVGKDIQPGTYRTRVGSSNCYYERLKGFSGSVDDIIANDDTDAPAIVTIKSTDKGFSSQNCGTWTKDLSQITSSKTSFDDGMFIVGTDIEPGTYKNSGGAQCYYARLSGFGGTTDDIIANNDVSTSTIVTISSSDKGFQSRGCGTWTKE